MEKKTRDMAFLAAAAASGAIAGAYVYAGLKTPLPGQDQDVAGGLTVEKHEFITADGVTLRVKRYANPQGTPVFFCHGFNGNGFEFDLPREGKNMAVYLARLGYDVWISSFRGNGVEPFLCDCEGWQHSIDHLAIYDAPALVDGIIAATGKQPFWIGHSMGGMVLYMYLQGVRFDGDWQVVSDPALVSEHAGKLAGGIAIASPPAFWWPHRHPMQVALHSGLGRGVLNAVKLSARARSTVRPRYRIGTLAKDLILHNPRLIQAASRSPIGMMMYCRANTDHETSTSLVTWAGDDVSTRMYVQLVDGLANTHMRSYFPLRFKGEPYDYTANMGLISSPMLFISGDKDLLAPESIKRFGYEVVASVRKKHVNLPGYGHTDLVMGLNVQEDVYPLLDEWMRETEGHSESTDAPAG